MKIFMYVMMAVALVAVVVHGAEMPTRAVVVAIDVSGSMKQSAGSYQFLIDDIIRRAPDDCRVCLIRFDETAAVVARTDSLSAGVRESLNERVWSLKPTAQFTDFRAAANSVAVAIRAAPRPCVGFIMTDAMPDPRPRVNVEGLDHCLQEVFPASEEGVDLSVVVPDATAAARLVPNQRFHVFTLGDFQPATVIHRAPAPAPPPVEAKQEPETPSGGIRWFHWAWFALMHLKTILYAMAVILALLLLLWIRRWVRRLSRLWGRTTKPEPDPIDPVYEIAATYDGHEVRLGAVEEVKQLTVGSVPGSDVPVSTTNGDTAEVVLKQRRHEEFTLRNRGDEVVQVDASDVLPGNSIRVRLPVTIGFGEGNDVHLALVQTNEEQIERRVVS
ncbi:VWA domain-containing protein [bacterium]|nr:VWA domain-containing protein [bacterium]